jgi:diguanylate cyclase (GGDEF)-like protein
MGTGYTFVRWWRGLPQLTAATAILYGCGAVLLVAGAATWVPGKNPRWVITSLAVVATVFLVWTLARGRRFTRAEGLVMVAAELAVVACLTWSTDLTVGAYANGTVLPVAALYVIWFMHPVAGRVVLYLGALGWLVAMVHQDDTTMLGFAASLMVQTVIAAEVFSQIKARLERVARTDQLTGVLNRRGITEVLDREMAQAVKRRRPLSVVAVDLDGLRTVNNTLGHTAGDRLLEGATRHWRDGLRPGDSVGRTGGDEFVLVLPGTTSEQADRILQRLTDGSAESWSAGVATAGPGDSAESVLERADQRMYGVKAVRRAADVPPASMRPTVQS